MLKNRYNDANSLFFSCFLKFSGKEIFDLHHSILKLEPNLSKTNNQIYLPYISSATYNLHTTMLQLSSGDFWPKLIKTKYRLVFLFLQKNYTLLFPQIIT